MPTTKKPYTNKTSQINPQTTTTKPLRFNIHFKVLDTPKDTPFYFKFRPYTPPTEDYTKFLAPTSHVQYQQIRQSSTEAPFTSPFVNHFYRISPRRGLEFKLFNKKLDQSTLASARDPKTGKIDFSKLEALTHTEYIEPVIRPRTIVRTLDTKPLDVVDRFSQQSDDDSGPFGKHRISRRPLVFWRHFLTESAKNRHLSTTEKLTTTSTPSSGYNRVFSWPNPKIYKLSSNKNKKSTSLFNVAQIPLDSHKIWDGKKGILTDSYGREISIKWAHK